MLRSGDPRREAYVLEQIRLRGRALSACAPDIMRLLLRKSGEKADAIAFALGGLGRDALPYLVKLASHENARMRRLAALGFSAMEPRKSGDVPLLIQLLLDPDERVSSAARSALTAYGHLCAADLVHLFLVGDQMRVSAVRELIADLGPNALPPLTSALKNAADEEQTVALLETIREMRPEAGELAVAVSQLLRDGSPAVRTAALDVLIAAGASAMSASPAVCELLNTSPSGYERWMALAALDRVAGEVPEWLLPTLTDAAGSPDPLVRLHAVRLIQRVETGGDTVRGALLASLGDPDLSVRAAAALALCESGVEDEQVLAVVRDSIQSGSPVLRRSVLRRLSQSQKAAAAMTELLVDLLPDKDSWIDSALAAAGAAAIPRLKSMMREGGPDARRRTIDVLERMDPVPRSGIDILLSATRSTAVSERRAAASVLRRVAISRIETVRVLADVARHEQDPEAAKALLGALSRVETGQLLAADVLADRLADPGLTLDALKELKRLGPNARAHWGRVERLLDHEAVGIRVAALDLLASVRALPSPPVDRGMSSMLVSPRREERLAALRAVGRFGKVSSGTIASVREALADPDFAIRRGAAVALYRANGSIRGISDLLGGPVFRLRVEAALAIRAEGIRSRLLLPQLIDGLHSGVPNLIVACCDALASMGAEAKDAIPAIERILSQSPQDASVLAAARDAIGILRD